MNGTAQKRGALQVKKSKDEETSFTEVCAPTCQPTDIPPAKSGSEVLTGKFAGLNMWPSILADGWERRREDKGHSQFAKIG